MKKASVLFFLTLWCAYSCNHHTHAEKQDRSPKKVKPLIPKKNPEINIAYLQGIWADSTSLPNAGIQIKKHTVYIVDKFEAHKYKVDHDTLIIYYDDYVYKELLLKVTKDSLISRGVDDHRIHRSFRYK